MAGQAVPRTAGALQRQGARKARGAVPVDAGSGVTTEKGRPLPARTWDGRLVVSGVRPPAGARAGASRVAPPGVPVVAARSPRLGGHGLAARPGIAGRGPDGRRRWNRTARTRRSRANAGSSEPGNRVPVVSQQSSRPWSPDRASPDRGEGPAGTNGPGSDGGGGAPSKGGAGVAVRRMGQRRRRRAAAVPGRPADRRLGPRRRRSPSGASLVADSPVRVGTTGFGSEGTP